MDLTLTMGSYPVLIVASAPEPFAVIGGIALFLAGALWALWPLVIRRAGEAKTLEAHGGHDG